MSDQTFRIVVDVESKTGEARVRSLESSFDSLGERGTSNVRKISDHLQQVTSRIFNVRNAVIALVGTVGISRLAGEFENLYAVQEQAEAGMRQRLISMDRYSAKLYDDLLDVAGGLQKMSTYGDEAIVQGEKFLLTYKDITVDLLPRTAAAMVDIAALMGGDMKAAAEKLGKASLGMTSELLEYGIVIDSTVYQSKGFFGVLEQIEAQVKGQAAAIRATDSGGLIAFGNAVKDVEEQFGKAITSIKANIARSLLPSVEDVESRLKKWMKTDEFKKWVDDTARAVFDLVKSGLTNIGKITEAMGTAYDVIAENENLATMGLVGYFLFGATGGAIGATIGKLVDSLEKMSEAERKTFDGVGDEINKLDWNLTSMAASLDTTNEKVKELTTSGLAVDTINGFFFNLNEKLKPTPELVKKVTDELGVTGEKGENALSKVGKQLQELADGLKYVRKETASVTSGFSILEQNRARAAAQEEASIRRAKSILETHREFLEFSDSLVGQQLLYNFGDAAAEADQTWLNMLEGIQTSTADAIKRMSINFKEGWSATLDDMKDWWRSFLSYILARALMTNIIIPVTASVFGGSATSAFAGMSGLSSGTGTGGTFDLSGISNLASSGSGWGLTGGIVENGNFLEWSDTAINWTNVLSYAGIAYNVYKGMKDIEDGKWLSAGGTLAGSILGGIFGGGAAGAAIGGWIGNTIGGILEGLFGIGSSEPTFTLHEQDWVFKQDTNATGQKYSGWNQSRGGLALMSKMFPDMWGDEAWIESYESQGSWEKINSAYTQGRDKIVGEFNDTMVSFIENIPEQYQERIIDKLESMDFSWDAVWSNGEAGRWNFSTASEDLEAVLTNYARFLQKKAGVVYSEFASMLFEEEVSGSELFGKMSGEAQEALRTQLTGGNITGEELSTFLTGWSELSTVFEEFQTLLDPTISKMSTAEQVTEQFGGTFDGFVAILKKAGVDVEKFGNLDELRAGVIQRELNALRTAAWDEYSSSYASTFGNMTSKANDELRINKWFDERVDIMRDLEEEESKILRIESDRADALEKMEAAYAEKRGDIFSEAANYVLQLAGTADPLVTSLSAILDKFDVLEEQLRDYGATEEELTRLTGLRVAALNAAVEAEQRAITAMRQATLEVLSPTMEDIAYRASGQSRAGWLMGQIQAGMIGGDMTLEDLQKLGGLMTSWYTESVQEAETAASDAAAAQTEAADRWLQVADTVSNLVDSIESTIRSMKYGDLSVALPGEKRLAAAGDYARLLAEARTGSPEAIQEFMSFSQEYLQLAQADLKSSQAYQDIYTMVLGDLESLHTDLLEGKYDLKIWTELSRQTELTEGISADLSSINSTFMSWYSWMTSATASAVPESSAGRAYAGNTAFWQAFSGFYAQDTGFNLPAMTGRIYNLGGGKGVYVSGTGERYDINLDSDLAELLRTVPGLKERWEASFGPAFDEGGIARGPFSGYPVTLHGPEAVIPLKDGDVPVRFENSNGDLKEVIRLLEALVARGSTVNVQVSVGDEVLDTRIRQVADDVRVQADQRGMTGRRIYT